MARPTHTEHTFDNGFLLGYEPTTSGIIRAKIEFYQGALHELPGEEGLAHFLEHCMFFAGSKSYSPNEARKIFSSFGYFNMGTGHEKTVVNAKFLPEDLEQFLELSADLTLFPRYDEKIFASERDVVVREINDSRSDDRYNHGREFITALLGDHPMQYDVLGDSKIVSSATVEQMRSIHARGMNVSNARMTLVGGIPDSIEHVVGKYFGSMKSGKVARLTLPTVEKLSKTTWIKRYASGLDGDTPAEDPSAEFELGFVSAPDAHKDQYPLSILSHILGGSTESRLLNELRFNRGLVYAVNTRRESEVEFGIERILGKCSARATDEVADAIFYTLSEVRNNGVSIEELQSAKKQMRYGFAKSKNSTGLREVGITVFWDTGVSIDEYVDRIEAVSLDDVNRVAREYLPDGSADGPHFVYLIRSPLIEKRN